VIAVTYLFHSGFWVDLPGQCLLFDWWKGELPPLPDKPLTVFVSHRHPDHFNPRIFTLDNGEREVRFVLGRGIRLTDRTREKWGLTPATAAKCRVVAGGETLALPGLEVEALPSTDMGVAFLVRAGETVLYHAGDLNWWHWEGEDPAWNRNMEVDFKRDLEPLRGRRIDLAMAPLDPRLGAAEGWGLEYLLKTALVRRVLPMHQWEDPSPTARFCAAHPQWAGIVETVSRPGQTFLLEEKA
jgi:L-ascorbate metabolism protein UlaG (beta-lactamase superfamily)